MTGAASLKCSLCSRFLRTKALEPVGFSKIVFKFMTDCEWNTVFALQEKALGKRVGFLPREMPPHMELVPG